MPKSRTALCVFCPWIGIVLALLYLLVTSASVQAQGKKSNISFIKDVAPILKKNCFGCHDPVKKKGKLDMTTYASFRKGGRNEDPIVPGKPKVSYLFEVLTDDGNRRMPPKDAGKPLPKEQIDIIAAWIKQGAKLDKNILAKADLRRELRLRWQPPALLTSYNDPALITALTFSPDGKHVLTSGFHEITVWNIDTGKLEQRLHTRAERAHDMEFLKDGKLVVAGGRPGQEGDVRIYNLNGKTKMRAGVAYLDGVSDKSVLVGQLVQTEDSIFSVAVSDDGRRLAAGGSDRLVRVWDISQGIAKAKLKHSIENHADWVLSVNFSADGKYLVTASRDKSAKIWILKSKESLVTFPSHQQYVFGAVMRADNKSAVSAGADKQIRAWNAQEKSKQLGRQIRAGSGHSRDILELVEHRKGKKQILATCSADGTVRLWDANTVRPLKTLTGLKDWVYSVAFSPDGARVAAGGLTGEVVIWNTANGKLLKRLNVSPGYEPVLE